MKSKKVLVIGLGETGSPLLEIVRGVYAAEGLDIEPKKVKGPVDVMHICFPYSENFTHTTVNYIKRFKPKLVLIESTVPPFTTSKIHEKTLTPVCHSPVRGRKADGFKWAYFAYTKFIGPAKTEFGKIAEKYYQSLGFKTHICRSSVETEFMKIIDTTYYGLLISWFQEIHRICRKFNLKEEEIVEFIRTDTVDSGGKHQRPIFYPGVIGGHCVIPNAKLLERIYPSPFLEILRRSNELRKQEIKLERNR